MRQLANLHDEQVAVHLLTLLNGRGLEARVDREADGETTTWTIWILSEDDVEQAESVWRQFRDLPEFLLAPDHESSDTTQSLSGSLPQHPLELGSIPVTLFIVALSILVSLISHFGTPRGTPDDNHLSLEEATLNKFALVNPTRYSETSDPLISIKQGEAWRVISSMFLHFDSLHLAFNTVWLFFLGSALEKLEGSLGIIKIVVVAHIAGLCAQVFLPTQSPLPISLNGNPLLLGTSGVVYGLFGYLWLRPKFDARYPLFLVHSNLLLMIGWLIFCLTPMAQPFANGAQIAGLLAGVLLASLSSKSPS